MVVLEPLLTVLIARQCKFICPPFLVPVRLHQGEIDLLLTNVVLRDVNGCDLSQKLLSICPKLKTLFISDDHNDMTARYCSVDEGVGVIKKPFSMNDLTVKIKKLINPILVVP